MSSTDPYSFAPNLASRGGGQYITATGGASKLSLSNSDAADRLISGRSWSRMGTEATVTFAFRATGTPPDESTSGFQMFSPAQIAQALKAMTAWSDVANIHFVRVDDGNGYSNNATILLGDYTSGGAAGYTYLPGRSIPQSGDGDVWINASASYNQNPTTGNYGGQVLVHEIGHALGFTHPSDYDDSDETTPTYAVSADHYEDSEQYSVMSYFYETYTGANYGNRYSAVPLIDDITGMQKIYGANMTTRTGDTVYGFNSNTGEDWFSATSSQSKLIFAVWDAGGNDTFDFSGFTQAQTIDLRQGAFSSVNGYRGNVAIAYGVTIENAIGGSGADTIIGNEANNRLDGGAGNDTLYGEAGDDTLRGGAGDDVLDGGSGSNVVDGGDGNDQLLLPGSVTDYRSSFSGGLVTITGNGITDIVSGVETIVVRGASSSSTYAIADFTARSSRAPIVHNGGLSDFNGDGHSDLLWRNANGAVSTWWIGGPQGDNQVRMSTYNNSIGTDWRIVETMDFNGDGRADILWRHAGGDFSIWDATSAGSFDIGSYYQGAIRNDWRIAGVGDFNGDGRDDILWQHQSGSLSIWQSTGTSFIQSAYQHASVGTVWKVQGVADFNGDGRADIIWRSDDGAVSSWLGNAAGGFAESAYFATGIDKSWHIAGLADFDGDGRSDIAWRNDNGSLTIWKSNGTGFTQASFNENSVSSDWTIAQVGDFNGDGRADILWRYKTGEISVWESNGAGFDRNVILQGGVGNDWQIQHHDFL